MLTLEGYRQAGGVHGALAQRADGIFNELSVDEQQIARRTLLRLTQPGEGTEDTRRRAARNELVRADGDDGFEAVLDRLVDARLLTTGRDETGQQVVDVSHEALIRGWPRLRDWIDADRAGLLIHRRLTAAAHEWHTLNREPASLYRGARLVSAGEWANDHDDDLSRLERDFLTASQANEHSEALATKRRTRRRWGQAIGSAVLAVIVAALAVAVSSQRDAARTLFRSQQALSVANELEKSLVLIENGLGRYVVTGKRSILASVNRALEAYPTQRDRLAHLVSDDPGQHRRVRQIGDAIDDYATFWAAPLIDLAREDLAGAADQVETNARRSRVDRIRRDFERLFERERAVIDQRGLRAESLSALAIKLGIGSLGLVLVIALGSTLYMRQSVGRRRPSDRRGPTATIP